VAAAAAAGGVRTLLISTDPAPSLGDALGAPLGASPRPVPSGRRATLHALEIDAPRALNRWLAARRPALERIALRGTWLDQEDVSRLLRLSLPGIDEIAALLEIARFAGRDRYDLIVVDTAPTGHTLRMLAMPETLLGVARVFDAMQAKHRVMVEALRGSWAPDEDDALIDALAEDARRLSALLRDSDRVRTSWVTLAEPMAVEETSDAVHALARQGIPLHDIIVNRMTPVPDGACRWCRARRAFEAAALESLRRQAGTWTPRPALKMVMGRDREPKGLPALTGIGKELEREVSWAAPRASRKSRARAPVPPVKGASSALARGMPLALAPIAETRLLMFGGKGGVGKTTCAAAAAIDLARRQPRRRILLLSTDPAHSLGDALSVRLTDEPRRIPRAPNLFARELDAARAFDRVKDRYREAIDGLFERFARTTAFDAGHDRRVLRDLIDLAPPGLDELAATIDVTDALTLASAEDRYDLLVVDTAPTGHAMRLLEMPALVQEWTRALMTILLKYQPVVGVGELGSMLLALSQGLGRLRALLSDPAQTRFVAVTRAAALPRAQTLRLLDRLARLRVLAPLVVVNAVGVGECRRCRRLETAARREIAALARAVRATADPPRIALAPARMPPPNGAAALGTWARSWTMI
jgi:arsenite-transporting ATPase